MNEGNACRGSHMSLSCPFSRDSGSFMEISTCIRLRLTKSLVTTGMRRLVSPFVSVVHRRYTPMERAFYDRHSQRAGRRVTIGIAPTVAVAVIRDSRFSRFYPRLATIRSLYILQAGALYKCSNGQGGFQGRLGQEPQQPAANVIAGFCPI